MKTEIKYKKYPAYKDSGVVMLGEIPEGWKVWRLKNICEMIVSNVDKHTKLLEKPVKLCNYVDVYKNDYITSEIDFMQATASVDEINRFKIKYDDVIITKDSEDWLDIGVPSFVKYEEYNLICAYHLAILRPTDIIIGNFLHRALTSPYIKTHFSVNANGVTRYGISQGAILSTFIAIPSLPEQLAIANFLDRKTALIDQAIDIKEKQIELLKERRQILINNAVTRGLNPDIKMKNSGVEWIGEIPEHWEVKRIKHISTKIGSGITPSGGGVNYLDSGIPLLRSQNIMFGKIEFEGVAYISEKTHSSMSNSQVKKGDVLLNITGGSIGRCHYIDVDFPINVNQHVCIVRPSKNIASIFLNSLLASEIGQGQIWFFQQGGGREGLNFQAIKNFIIPLPSIDEQGKISEYIENTTAKFSNAISLKEKEIEKLKEYKSTLINNAVTGKIKVS